MHNVSTRYYRRVIPEMAESVGISKSSVSRRFIEERPQELERPAARRFDESELLIIYLGGLIFGEPHVLCAVGVDARGNKPVLGMVEGAGGGPGAAAASQGGAVLTLMVYTTMARARCTVGQEGA
jgi:transposase-like protein